MHIHKTLIVVAFLSILVSGRLYGQAGISVTPPRVYFEMDAGQTQTHKVTVSNVSSKHTMSLAVSLADWEYDSLGNNVTYPAATRPASCAAWTHFNPNAYFSLKPGESKDIEVSLTAPQHLSAQIPVYTTMLYVTQMNPVDGIDEKGTSIKIAVRSGIKIYYKPKNFVHKQIEIENLQYNNSKKALELFFKNKGNSWTDGTIAVELVNTSTGKQIKLPVTDFYSLPGDIRHMILPIGNDLAGKTKYVATVILDIGDENTIEVAELTFTHD